MNTVLPKKQIEAEFTKERGIYCCIFYSNDNVLWWLKGFEMATSSVASRLGLTKVNS